MDLSAEMRYTLCLKKNRIFNIPNKNQALWTKYDHTVNRASSFHLLTGRASAHHALCTSNICARSHRN